MSYFPTWKLKTSGIIAPDERLPIGQTLALGVQHVVAMFGSTVLAPLLMGFDPNLCILMSGLGTLIFFLLVGGHVPSYLGSSFAFIGVVISATGYVAGSGMNPNIPTALGGIVICGLIYAIVDAWIAILTVLCVGGVAVYTRGLIQKLLILVGLSLAYVIYAILTNGMGLGTPINFAKISEAAWFGMPQFETPVFSLSAITLIAPVVIILVGENLGHIKAVTAMTGRNLDPYMGRAFLGDGLATMFSASCGGTGVTTYGENIGVMAATRVYSTLLFPVAACFAIILGFSPKFGAVIQTIPQPILGGTSIVVFGLIAVAGARVWVVNHVDFGDNRNLIVAAVTLILGGGDFTIHLGNFTLGGIGTATFGAIILNALMEFGERRVSGTIEEEPHEANLDAQADKQ